MRVIGEGIIEGVIQDKHRKHGAHFNENGVPTFSLPFEILMIQKKQKVSHCF